MLMRGLDISRRHTTNDDTRPHAGPRKQATGTFPPKGRARINFRCAPVQRTDAPVVGRHCAFDFGVAAHRGTNHETGWRDPARALREKVVRAEMRTRRAGSDRDVQPIVHEHGNVERLHQSPRMGEQIPIGGALQPQLNGRHPARNGGGTQVDEVAIAQQRIVGHQHEAKGVG